MLTCLVYFCTILYGCLNIHISSSRIPHNHILLNDDPRKENHTFTITLGCLIITIIKNKQMWYCTMQINAQQNFHARNIKD
jgi:uncharacterized protein (DUF608 family)